MGKGIGRMMRASRGELSAMERMQFEGDGEGVGGVGYGGASYDVRNSDTAVRMRTRYAVRMQEMERETSNLRAQVQSLQAEVNALRSR